MYIMIKKGIAPSILNRCWSYTPFYSRVFVFVSVLFTLFQKKSVGRAYEALKTLVILIISYSESKWKIDSRRHKTKYYLPQC